MKSLFNNLANLLLVLLLSLIGLLPLRLAQALGAALGRLFYRLGRKRIRIARCNLKACFPQMDARARELLLQRNLMESGKWFAEFGIAWLWSPQRACRRIKVRDADLLAVAHAHGHGVVLIIPHLGNWEMVNAWVSTHYPFAALYQPLASSWFERFILYRRSRQGTFMAPATGTGVRQLLKCLKAGHVVGILPDHRPSRAAGVMAPFFGQPALTGKLAARLVAANGSQVLSATAVRKPAGQGFELIFQSVSGLDHPDPLQAATALNRAIEACIALAPEQYQWGYRRFPKHANGRGVYDAT